MIHYTDKTDFCHYYFMTGSQMQVGFPISSNDFLQKLFSDPPLNYIIDLRIYPFTMLLHAPSEVSVQAGDITISSLKGYEQVPVYSKTSSIAVPAGSSFLDFEPYSSAQIYLPFLGFYPINLREIRGDTVNIKYDIDVSIGECTCYLSRNSNGTLLNVVSGSIGESVPIIGSDAREKIQRRLSTAVSIGAGLATGGGAAAIVTGFAGGVTKEFGANGPIVKGTFSGGQTDFSSPKKPFIVINTQKSVAVSAGYRKNNGLPSGYTGVLSSLTGYTECESVHVEGFTCTAEEADEIQRLLESGVIL